MKIRSYMHKSIIALALCSSYITPKTPAKDIIFDFGGVLLFTNKHISFRHIGMINIATCSLQLKINPLRLDQYIRTKLYNVFDAIAEIHQLSEITHHQTYDEHGHKLPFLMCAWLQGIMTSSEIKALIEKEISLHPEWFACRAEQRIIENTSNMIFNPQLLVNSRKVSKEAIAFIKRCKKEGHRVYGLSNWDAESFVLLKEKYQELFKLFDGIIISGEIKANKPHPTIYQALLDRYQLKAENCWFIDDQQENIDAAQKLGINAIRHTSTFSQLIKNIKLAYSKSLSLPKNLNTSGISDTNIKKTSNAIIDGENISLTDSTKYNCLPAKA